MSATGGIDVMLMPDATTLLEVIHVHAKPDIEETDTRVKTSTSATGIHDRAHQMVSVQTQLEASHADAKLVSMATDSIAQIIMNAWRPATLAMIMQNALTQEEVIHVHAEEGTIHGPLVTRSSAEISTSARE